jgi:hypothetical protein
MLDAAVVTAVSAVALHWLPAQTLAVADSW